MKSLCLISGSSPEFLGGVSLYQRNLIEYTRQKKLNLEVTWIYAGNKDKEFNLENFKCIELKSCKLPFLKEFSFSKRVKKYLDKQKFDFINTQANWGYCLKKYQKKKGQKIIHTYHGVTYHYMKIQFERFGFFKYLFYPLLPFFILLKNLQ